MSDVLATESVWQVLEGTYGPLRNASKLLARDAGNVSPRTAQDWLSGAIPNGWRSLLHLMASNKVIAAEIMRLVEEARCQTQD